MNNKKIYVSPLGIAKYLHVAKPNTKFKEGGEYSVDLVVDEAAAKSFRELMDPIFEEGKAEILADPKNSKNVKKIEKYTVTPYIKPEEDADGNETGNYVIRFKNGATFKDKNDQIVRTTIAVVDAKKKPISADKLGRGSSLKIAFQVSAYAMPSSQTIGLSFRMKAVQVINFVEFGGGGADAFAEEDGYEGEEAAGDTAPPPDSGDDF